MNVPLVDLSKQYESMKDEIKSAVNEVMPSGRYVSGRKVQEFEQAFARFCGAESGVGVSNGADAIHLTLLALRIRQGDEVITAGNTFHTVISSIMLTGAKPVVADVEENTYNIDPEELKRKITQKTKAIIPVHLYGQMAEMDEILEIAEDRDISVIEDASQAHGAEYKGKKAGGFGHAACFSLYPAKNLGAAGEAGIIVTSDDELAEKCRVLRSCGEVKKYKHELIGFNRRMDEIQAAILLVKLKRLEYWNERRREIAALYDSRISGTFLKPKVARDRKHVYHLYVIRSSRRDSLKQHLSEKGIETGVHYPTPIHLQEAFSGFFNEQLPIAEKLSREILSLPIYPEMTDEQAGYVAETVNGFE